MKHPAMSCYPGKECSNSQILEHAYPPATPLQYFIPVNNGTTVSLGQPPPTQPSTYPPRRSSDTLCRRFRGVFHVLAIERPLTQAGSQICSRMIVLRFTLAASSGALHSTRGPKRCRVSSLAPPQSNRHQEHKPRNLHDLFYRKITFLAETTPTSLLSFASSISRCLRASVSDSIPRRIPHSRTVPGKTLLP